MVTDDAGVEFVLLVSLVALVPADGIVAAVGSGCDGGYA